MLLCDSSVPINIDNCDTPSPVYKYRTSGMQHRLQQYSLQKCNKQNEIEQHASLHHLVRRTLRMNGGNLNEEI